MNDGHLFDTDVLIDAGRGVEDAVDALERASSKGPLAISVVTQMELIVGCRNKRELATLNDFLHRFVILPLRSSISREACSLLYTFRLSHGLLIPDALRCYSHCKRNAIHLEESA